MDVEPQADAGQVLVIADKGTTDAGSVSDVPDAGSASDVPDRSAAFAVPPTLGYYALELREASLQKRQPVFVKSLHWSPDGTCLLANCEDRRVRLYDFSATVAAAAASLPPAATASICESDPASQHQPSESAGPALLRAALTVTEAEPVHDLAWFPGMRSSDAASCCYASASRDQPIHLWDAYSGRVRCSYRGYRDPDELRTAYSVAFSPFGDRLYVGYSGLVRTLDVAQPTAAATELSLRSSLAGVVSTISFRSDGRVWACGCYGGSPGGRVALCSSEGTPSEPLLVLQPSGGGGVSQVLFAGDGNLLVVASRRSSGLDVWDLRAPQLPLLTIPRASPTNQKLQVAERDGIVAFGDVHGAISLQNLGGDSSLLSTFNAHTDAIAGCAFHPTENIIASGSGQRHFSIEDDDSDDDAWQPDAASLFVWSYK
eukprot:TRINITY_DN27293_c0_g1_i1.p1 TRINITY_DN27293_c0_g1~~TRINITY_DN27293_c0_g1_i1.p1  ORF type:complete len:430 (-),score=79.20 TRINITY_DN27293_c0_g1_i1:11-1300(-)